MNWIQPVFHPDERGNSSNDNRKKRYKVQTLSKLSRAHDEIPLCVFSLHSESGSELWVCPNSHCETDFSFFFYDSPKKEEIYQTHKKIKKFSTHVMIWKKSFWKFLQMEISLLYDQIKHLISLFGGGGDGDWICHSQRSAKPSRKDHADPAAEKCWILVGLVTHQKARAHSIGVCTRDSERFSRFFVHWMCRKHPNNNHASESESRQSRNFHCCLRLFLFHFSFALTFDLCDIFNFHSLWLSLKLNHAFVVACACGKENPDKSQTVNTLDAREKRYGEIVVLIL